MPLDEVLDDGLRAHDLLLMGGVPGVGKTVAALQMARNMAAAGSTAIYACYEHDEVDLLGRLLLLELGALARREDAVVLDKLRVVVREAAQGLRSLDVVGEGRALLDAARDAIADYADRLLLVCASGRHTGVAELEQLVTEHGNGTAALFVDYLQKVAVKPDPRDEGEKVTAIAEGLKELALAHDCPVVAVVAADRASLDARRLRMHHLRGSSALAYESDVVLILNEKFSCVSKVHLAYDARRAETYRHYAVWSIEKNRSGPTGVDLEFRKDFAHYRFDPLGGHVAERLVDERFDVD
ncbi:MAG TPA: DnaB-like helicase C-terminal domain-containing protein [Egibacteraceae bacterium]|jgi:replicative DNA helicase|nr:DnaB-like helicase C-terminal domain-containing protein [Egibacteraceae bacterium]